MKQCIQSLAARLAVVFLGAVFFAAAGVKTAMATERPSCVLMKFTNATRFQALDSDEVFSSLVMERLMASRRFNMREAAPLMEDMEALLYGTKNSARQSADAVQSGDLHALFESAQFNPAYASSISAAKRGQIVAPAVTSAIGKTHEADYLIHGTIVQIGNGRKGGGFWFVKTKSTQIGVMGELRIIRAATGEVIWWKRATGIGRQNQTTVSDVLPDITFGDDAFNANLYAKAMDDVARQLVDAMLADMDTRKLFVT